MEALWRKGLRKAEHEADNSFHCRTANCEAFCIYDEKVKNFLCPLCGKNNCILCKGIHEGMDCEEYQKELKRRAMNDEAAKETQRFLEVYICIQTLGS